ncbi:MAG: hypothetical protein PHI55_12465 [Burkholderiaceae bacterium]|nr:hypothetical protein [Burkholderiaceae bacterium]
MPRPAPPRRALAPLAPLAGAALLAAALGGTPPVRAQALKGNFSVYMVHTVLCYNAMDTAYVFDQLKKQVGPPYKRDQGAYWWKVNLSIQGVPATELFVAEPSATYQFVGALLDQSPKEAAPTLNAKGPAFRAQQTANPYSPLASATGSTLLWQDKKGKLACARKTDPGL